MINQKPWRPLILTFLIALAGGAARTSGGAFLRIYRRQPDGSWRMTRDMFNSGP